MWLIWFYLFFIAASQTYVLASMLIINPPVVDASVTFVECERMPHTIMDVLSREACDKLDVAFELPSPQGEAGGSDGASMRLRRFEQNVYYYSNMFSGDAKITSLQLVCCVWVTVQCYFNDFQNVAQLLRFRDFTRWILPLKGEELRRNGWVMLIPALQYSLGLCVVVVSCTVTCGTGDAFDIVLNSLAFTFISQVARFFNEPLTNFYSRQPVSGLDESVYGTEPIYYLVVDYSEENSMPRWEDSWYIRKDQLLSGLITDFKFRHLPGSYPMPNERNIERLRVAFFCVPALTMLLCWALFTRQIELQWRV